MPSTEELTDAPMIVRELDKSGFVRVNDSFKTIVGYDAAELAEEPFVNWIAPCDLARVQAALENGEGSFSARHLARDGRTIQLEMRVAEDKHGRFVLGRCSTASTCREEYHANAEETVLGTLDIIARIMEEQHTGYKCSILLVSNGRLVSGAGPSLPNEYNAAIDGYAVGPNVGSCGTAIFWGVPVIVVDIQADPLWGPFAKLAKKAGVAACWSHPFVSRQGEVLGAIALYSSQPRAPTAQQLRELKSAARMTGLAVERGRAEEELRANRKRELEMQEKLAQTQRLESLGVLAGGIAHDFNNILMTIMGHADLALDELSPLSPGRENITEIVTASKRAAELCSQMLAYAGKGRFERRNMNLGTLVEETLHMLKACISKKSILNLNLEKGLPCIHGDSAQVRQILMNLVINASEAIGDRDGIITISTETVDCSEQYLAKGDILAPANLRPGPYVYIEVSDTGCGMDKNTVQRIFEPFFTTKFTGRGLGLSALMGIVKSHKGALRVYSEPGKGSTFKVMFPAIEETEEREPEEREPEGDLIDAWHGFGTVLLVDDEKSIRAVCSKQLQRLGFEVLTAEDGRQAVDIYCGRKADIALVLLDLTMPHMNGEEVYRELRQINPDVRVILASGYSENDVSSRFAGKGLAGCLHKPYTLTKLSSLLSTLLPKAEPTTPI